MKETYGRFSPAILIESASFSADSVPASVDITGFEGALILIEVGAGGITFTGTNKVEFKLTHSDDDISYSAVAQGDVQGATVGAGGIIKSLIVAHATPDVTRVGYHGGKRFLKLLADFGGTHASPTPLSALVLRTDPHIGPVA